MIKRLKALWREKLCFWYYQSSYEDDYKWYSELTYWIWSQSWDAANGLYKLFNKRRIRQRYKFDIDFNPVIVDLWRFFWRVSLPFVGPFILMCVIGRMAFGWDRNRPEYVRWYSGDKLLRKYGIKDKQPDSDAGSE